MAEKISESHVREEKVRKVKEKILTEIKKEQERAKWLMQHGNKSMFDVFVEEYYHLMQLKNYMENKNSFSECETMVKDNDYVVYTVATVNIDIWLQENYNFTRNFLSEVEERPWALYEMLTDEYFGYHFTSILEKAMYDQQNKN